MGEEEVGSRIPFQEMDSLSGCHPAARALLSNMSFSDDSLVYWFLG